MKGSVKKWEKIVAGTGVDLGSNNCPLCEAFHSSDCEGCPVAEITKQPDCEGTPYYAWKSKATYRDSGWGVDEFSLSYAKDMLAFLKSVLPK